MADITVSTDVDTMMQAANDAAIRAAIDVDQAGTDNSDTAAITLNTAKITYPSADSTKLSGIETSADVTDTDNVTSAGALMDSELTSIADVKALDQSVVSGAAPVLAATNMTGLPTGTPEGTAVLSTSETVGKVLQADGDNTCSWVTPSGGGDALVANPLSQFAATTSLQFKGVISDETGSGSVVFATSPTLVTPALGTPTALVGTNISGTASSLTVGATTGVEANADVTDTANVTSAGALMDSEVDADIKTLVLPASTTISTFGASLIDDAAASNARTTLGVVIGTDVQAFDTDNAVTDVAQEYTQQQNFNSTTLTFDATQDWNLAANQVCRLTLTANTTFDLPTNIVDGSHYTIVLIQGGVGSFTAAYNAGFLFPGGTAPTLSTAVGAIDVVHCFGYGTTQLLCTSALAFA